MNKSYFHPTAIIEKNTIIGSGVHIWHHSHVRTKAMLGDNVSLGKDVFIDQEVNIKKGSRIQNGVSIYRGVNIGEWCFVGPHVVFTNDTYPRAGNKKWEVVNTNILAGASIGAGSIIICGIEIGAFAMIGAGSLVTKDVPDFTLSLGQPSIIIKQICACGRSSAPISNFKFKKIQNCCNENLNEDVIILANTLIDS